MNHFIKTGMKSLFTSTLLFLVLAASAQEYKSTQDMEVVTSREPYFPEGEQALYNYILRNVSYSEEAKSKYVEGEVMLSFDVFADSTIQNVIIISDAGYQTGEEVKKLVEKLKFIPAIQNKTIVKMNVMMSFPVKAH